MARARPVDPDKKYMLGRRVTQRQFLLKPTREVTQAFEYCLGVAAQRFDVDLHAYCAMSNHFHLAVTDGGCELPRFMHWFDLMIARCLNEHWGRRENFWAPGSYSRVELVGDGDVVAKMVYTLTNPVAAGLVHDSREWHGARSAVERIGGEPLVVKRPEFFFRKDGSLPDEVELVVKRPEIFPEDDDESFREMLSERVWEREQQIRDEFAAGGRRFMKPIDLVRLSPFGRPGEEEPPGRLNPTIAAADPQQRAERLEKQREWLEAYDEARRSFAAGDHDVIFPAGTYWYRVHSGARCRAPP